MIKAYLVGIVAAVVVMITASFSLYEWSDCCSNSPEGKEEANSAFITLLVLLGVAIVVFGISVFFLLSDVSSRREEDYRAAREICGTEISQNNQLRKQVREASNKNKIAVQKAEAKYERAVDKQNAKLKSLELKQKDAIKDLKAKNEAEQKRLREALESCRKSTKSSGRRGGGNVLGDIQAVPSGRTRLKQADVAKSGKQKVAEPDFARYIQRQGLRVPA